MLGEVPFWGGSSASLCDKVAVLLTSAVDEGGNVRLARLSSDLLHSSIFLPKSLGARVVVLARHSRCCLALLFVVGGKTELSLTIVSEMHCLQLVEIKQRPGRCHTGNRMPNCTTAVDRLGAFQGSLHSACSQ